MRVKYHIFIFALASFSNLHVYAGNKLSVNLQQADSIFLANNLSLLASSMNIGAQKALEIQAKAYPNPTFSFDINAYDPENKKWFHAFGPTGENDAQFSQLILLGGKRKKQIEMAKTNTAIAEIEFRDLLGQLKCRLHSDLFEVGQQQSLIHKYKNQLSLLDSILTQYQVQADKGNIALSEVVRLKGAYLSLSNQCADLRKSYYDNMTELQTLLHTDQNVEFVFSENDIAKYIQLQSFENLKEIALMNSPQLLAMQQNKTLAQQYMELQKKQNIPDVTFNTSYDHTGGSFVNQVNVGLSFDIPLWDRNKGNIKASKLSLKAADYSLQAKQEEILTTIRNNLVYYTENVAEYEKARKMYNDDFETTFKGMVDNFQKRNVSIIEFVDFFDAYNSALTELSRTKTQLVESGEQLNLLVGKEIY